MREYRRYLSSFVLYTNNPQEIALFKAREELFQPLCEYTTLDGEKCIGAEFLFEAPGGIDTLVGARRFIEKQLKEWKWTHKH